MIISSECGRSRSNHPPRVKFLIGSCFFVPFLPPGEVAPLFRLYIGFLSLLTNKKKIVLSLREFTDQRQKSKFESLAGSFLAGFFHSSADTLGIAMQSKVLALPLISIDFS